MAQFSFELEFFRSREQDSLDFFFIFPTVLSSVLSKDGEIGGLEKSFHVIAVAATGVSESELYQSPPGTERRNSILAQDDGS